MGFSLKTWTTTFYRNTWEYTGKPASDHKARLQILYTRMYNYRRVCRIALRLMLKLQASLIAICDWPDPKYICSTVNNVDRSAISNRNVSMAREWTLGFIEARSRHVMGRVSDCDKRCNGGLDRIWMRLIVFGVRKVIAYQMQEGNVQCDRGNCDIVIAIKAGIEKCVKIEKARKR